VILWLRNTTKQFLEVFLLAFLNLAIKERRGGLLLSNQAERLVMQPSNNVKRSDNMAKKTFQFDSRKEASAFTKKKGGSWKIEKLSIFGVSWFNVVKKK
tara:strand:+ start:9789 stop:10085 length:297 start_codon:yes stop_codon:yes gene_type:complete